MTHWLRAAIALAMAAIAALTPITGALAAIGPYTVQVAVPTSTPAGTPFEATVRSVNGGDPVSSWSISISLPDGGTARIVSPAPFTSGQSYARVFAPGDRIFSFSPRQSVAASYPLAEVYRQQTWPRGAERSLRIQVTPPSGASELRLFIRVTVRDSDGTVISFPGSADETDQQGLPALVRTVQIVPRATATAVPPTSTPRPSATSTTTPSLSPTVPPTATPTQQPTAMPTQPPTATSTPRPTATSTVRPTETAPPVGGPVGTVQPTPAGPPPTPPTSVAGRSPTLNFFLTLAALLVIAGLVTLFTTWRSRRSPLPLETGVERAEMAPPPRVAATPGDARERARGPDLGATTQLPVIRASPPDAEGTPTVAFQTFPRGLVPRGEVKRGGMADVYRAYQPALDRDVALKMPKPGMSIDAGFAARFHDEARRTARLNHPNIITVYDVGEVAGMPYITMRYVDGPSLADLVARQGGIPARRSLGILEQVARALDYAHGQGVVHGDVKPSNVLLEDEDRVTLTDFGIGRVIGTDGPAGVATTFGTPDYISPEQARGEVPGPRADVYSLGVVAYELLVGRKPFSAENPLALVYAHAYSTPPPPDQLNPRLAAAVAQVLLRALAKDPAQRYGSGGEFVTGLRQALGVSKP